MCTASSVSAGKHVVQFGAEFAFIKYPVHFGIPFNLDDGLFIRKAAARGFIMNRIVRKRSENAQCKALETILHEMVILASALLLRDKRYAFEKYPHLQWGPPQIANDVIRLKLRLLFDFFYPKKHKHLYDISVDDFTILGSFVPVTTQAFRNLQQVRDDIKRINRWTIHLSWLRTEDAEYSKTERQLMEEYATALLSLGQEFIDAAVANGLRLEGWALPLHENFIRLNAYLQRTPRIDEDNASVPDERINLEHL
jgi:hypothetical protein